ncbi:hypothetical protein Q667_06330 [Marinobacter sp. C1S70]|nr:hypothetical protein Q667_06330 [Marinobacter sp. C1S70]
MPGPSLKTAPSLLVKGAILIEQFTPKPGLHNDVDAINIKDRLVPATFRQLHPEPGMLTTIAARRVRWKTNVVPVLWRVFKDPQWRAISQKRGITPAILPSLIHRLDSGKSRLGQTDPEGDDHQQKSDATSGRVQSRTRFQE